MDIGKSSNGTKSSKTLEEWLRTEDDFDFQSFLEEDIEDAIIEEPKKREPEQELKFGYGSNWLDAPMLFLPHSVLWFGLDQLAEKMQIASKLVERHKWKKDTVEKWIHRINCVLALATTCTVLLAIFAVLIVVGIDKYLG